MVELIEKKPTKEDGSITYEPLTVTVKVVKDKTNKQTGSKSRGFIFNERPNDGPDTEWWNATAPTIKRNPHILTINDGDQISVNLAHGPKINQEGQHVAKADGTPDYWNNINGMTVVAKSESAQAESVEPTNATPVLVTDVPKRIDSFPKNLDYNVDKDNKIVLQTTFKSQIELTNGLLSANSDISGIYENYEEVLKRNIEKSERMIDEVWNNRTKIQDWEIPE